MKKITLLFLTILTLNLLLATPPHPLKKQGILQINEKASEKFGPRSHSKTALPQNTLVLLCQFPDKQFISTAQYPDYYPHNISYFDKYMQHVKNYFLDASSEKFQMNYQIWPTVANLSKNMSYYGDDKIDGERRAELAKDVIDILDPEIDYSQYDAVIIFHAGGGQESDIYNTQTQSIWSTFLTKSNLKEGLDPDNNNYQGIQTQDNTVISELVIVPESERHPDFPQADNPLLDEYDFSMLGVLIHQYAHQLGLPTLFDNYSANGSSSGIGNFGLMGTAVWNNNGKTPCLPCAWSRYYMGWSDVTTINSNADNLILSYPMDKDSTKLKIYKLPISDKEYFLIENRQHNPRRDSVLISGNWVEYPLHSFDVLPDSIQDFYPDTNIPIVNLLENNLRGSEWDYFLPYMNAQTGDYTDPSGILIWHIDENIIDQNFTADFSMNRVNGDALHKGVDLEEADGVQHLDFSLPDSYMRGSPFDSFRGDRVNQFTPDTRPNSDSYYGKSNIKITNISDSGNLMHFNVRFNQTADFNATQVIQSVFFAKNNTQIVCADINANLHILENGIISDINSTNPNDSLLFNTTLDTDGINYLLPVQSNDNAVLKKWNGIAYQSIFTFNGNKWINQILSLKDLPLINNINIKNILPLQDNTINNTNILNHKLVLVDNNDQIIDQYLLNRIIVSNLSYKQGSGFVYYISKDLTNTYLSKFNLLNGNITESILDISVPDKNNYLLQADFDSDNQNEFSITFNNAQQVKTYLITQNGGLKSGFPVSFYSNSINVPSIADYDRNGTLDLIIGNENGYKVVAWNAALINVHFKISDPDSSGVCGGVLPVINDNNLYLLGSISHNRLAMWNNEGKMQRGYPITFMESMESYPAINVENDSVFAYFIGKDGGLFKQFLNQINAANYISDNSWTTAYGNYYRSSAWEAELPVNENPVSQIIISEKTYIYPNPLTRVNPKRINIQVTLNKNALTNVKVYDIAGNLIYKHSDICNSYIPNNTSFIIDANKLSTGVYFAIIEASGKTKRLKFAVEK